MLSFLLPSLLSSNFYLFLPYSLHLDLLSLLSFFILSSPYSSSLLALFILTLLYSFPRISSVFLYSLFLIFYFAIYLHLTLRYFYVPCYSYWSLILLSPLSWILAFLTLLCSFFIFTIFSLIYICSPYYPLFFFSSFPFILAFYPLFIFALFSFIYTYSPLFFHSSPFFIFTFLTVL